jgi:hypothetical protein
MVAGVLALVATGPARAQQTAPPEVARPAEPIVPPSTGRELNGHLFMPSELVLQPFIETDFRSVTGAGTVRSERQSINPLGLREPTTREFSQLGYSQRFELQVKILEWLAVRGQATGLVFSGTNGRSILNLGSILQYAVGGGLTVGRRFGNIQAAVTADAAYEPTYSVDIGGAIGASLRAGEVDTTGLVERDRGVPLRVGLSGAYAPLPSLGIQAMARYEHTFRERSTLEREDAFIGAAAVDFDFRAISRVPIGLLVAYQFATPFGQEDRTDLWHYLNGGIFYTGKRELVLGLETSFRRFPQRELVESEAIVANVVIRYYW